MTLITTFTKNKKVLVTTLIIKCYNKYVIKQITNDIDNKLITKIKKVLDKIS